VEKPYRVSGSITLPNKEYQNYGKSHADRPADENTVIALPRELSTEKVA
jgi:hypothetical protein